MALQLRRGTDADRLLITPAEGELIYTTDTKKLYVGDGTTLGGNIYYADLEELNDVEIVDKLYGQVIYYDSGDELWKNATTLTVKENQQRIGINTSTPDATLEVVGDAIISTSASIGVIDINTTAGQIDTNSGANLTLDSDGGNVYVNDKLTVNGGLFQTTSTSAERPVFQYENNAEPISSGIFLRKNFGASTFTTGDGTQTAYQLVSDSQALRTYGLVGVSYDSSTPTVYFATNTAANTTGPFDTVGEVATNLARFYSPTLRLNSQDTSQDVSIQFNSTKDLHWDHAEQRFEFNGNLYLTNSLFNNGNDLYMGSGSTSSVVIHFNSSNPKTLKWNHSASQFEFDADVYITGALETTSGATLGTIDIGLTAGQIDTNSGYNLTLDSDGGNVYINDNLYVSENVVITGDLTVNGTTTNIDTTNLVIEDNLILLNKNETGAGVTAGSAGVEIERGSANNVQIRWNETSDRWETTTNGSTYIEIPDQDLDTTANPTFAGVTAGNIRVGITGDNEIDTASGGLTLDSATGTVTIDDELVITGDLQVSGNDIKGSAGSTAITISSTDVAIAGDLTVTGNDIKSSGGTTAITLSSADVTVAGILQVTGNNIKSSAGTIAINLSGINASIAGDLTVNGGDIVMTAATANIANTTATTVNIGGAATTVSIGADTGTTTINNSLVADDLQVTGSVSASSVILDTYAVLDTGTTSTTSTSQVAIATSTRNAMKILVKISDNVTGDVHCCEALVLRNGASALSTIYAELYSTAALATFDADVSGGNIRLLATPASSNDTTIRVFATTLS